MKRAAMLCVALLSCGRPPAHSSAGKAEPTLRGHVFAETGKPLPLAHVTLLGRDGKPAFRREVAGDGSFAVPLSSGTRGIARFSISDAAQHTAPVVVALEDGAVDVTVKLAKASTIDFAAPASASAGLTASALRVSEGDQRLDALLDEALHAKGGPPKDLVDRLHEAQDAEWAAARQTLATRAKTAHSAIVRQAATVAYFHGTPIESPSDDEKALANRVLAEVAPDDALWAEFRSLDNVLKVAAPAPKNYARAFIAQQPDNGAVAAFLLDQLADANLLERRELFSELKKPRYAGTPEQAEANAYDPDGRLAPGKDVSFEVSSLTASGKLTPKDFAGKVFLVEVWGTWCVPCVAEMPRLHELYAKYGGKKFEILSIALEHTKEPVLKFREDKAHPMPWLHGLADPDTFLESFSGPGFGVPLYVLVDGQGKIIGASPDLRLAELPELLDRVLR